MVLDLSKQLPVINTVPQTLVKSTDTRGNTEIPSSSQQVPKSPTLLQEQMPNQVNRTEQLRKQLEAEKEKN